MKVARKGVPLSERLGCIRIFMLIGLLWVIFVGLNALVRFVAPGLEFKMGQVSITAVVLSIVELVAAWWVSLKFTNAILNPLIDRARVREAERERREEEEAARAAPPPAEGETATE